MVQSSPSSSDLSSSLCTTPPPSSSKSRRPLRPRSIGVDPSLLVGKVLMRLSRSLKHPTLTLDFSDNTTFQVLVDGYDPVHRGLPKELEMDSSLEQLLGTPTGQALVERTIEDCALITLSDKAFESKERDQRWDQDHIGLAFRFSEDRKWHCVWVTLTDHDGDTCVFRSYGDVYVDQLHRSPRKRRSHVPHSIDIRQST
ncbi:hypothetical protein K503DRAFT_736344 [Rhizopogon vinicolor AM-OR11-026]|uniref:Uncharacterized protein n=1 Tax=Rhizopogon vinicolor AM-OR11-026 TaxID=1314800 RepID=A0A1B7N8A5_9AGAM|nr:hypothetical protein K503DRAFT_736344 [Rhizopogon vinicolor AM-OR11-026]